jgi:aminoglycoside/choline kinase family phosphotransferase
MVLAGSGLPLSSEELCLFPEPPRELPFLDVHRLLRAIGAAVPGVYAADLDSGILLLEDGGDVVLWDRVAADPAGAEALYRRALAALAHELDDGVMVLSHRDYHSWNILMRGDAPLIIDFQDALLAPPEYDVASLLTDRVTPRIVSPAMAARLRAYYWRLRGREEDERARRRYALAALQRVLKVIGRIHYIALEKQKPAPLAFLPDVVATARRCIGEAPLPGGLAEEFDALPWPAPESAA